MEEKKPKIWDDGLTVVKELTKDIEKKPKKIPGILHIDFDTEEPYEDRIYYPRRTGEKIIKHLTKRNRKTGEITLIVKWYSDDGTENGKLTEYTNPIVMKDEKEYFKKIKDIEETKEFRNVYDVENVDIRWDNVDWKQVERKDKVK